MWMQLYGVILFCLCLQQAIQTDSDYSNVTASSIASTAIDDEFIYRENSRIANCSSTVYPSQCNCYHCSGTRCTLCCRMGGRAVCCYCYSCESQCWNTDWQLTAVVQAGVSTALLFAIIATIVLFCRICMRNIRLRRASSEPLEVLPSPRISVSSTQHYIIHRLQDRPPGYNEISDAPPLYGTEPSRAATAEPPPVYPGTQEVSEGVGNSVTSTRPTEESVISGQHRAPVAQHI